MIQYVGLDFETSGSDPWGDAVPIQLGLAVSRGGEMRTASIHIGQWDWTTYPWDEGSEAIHGISRDRLANEPPVWVADIRAANWLIEQKGWRNRMFTVPVGFNVASFDRQFVTRWMPNLDRVLSYRTVDLNALLFLEAGDEEARYGSTKKRIKQQAEHYMRQAGIEPAHHDGCYDAMLALVAFDLLRDRKLSLESVVS